MKKSTAIISTAGISTRSLASHPFRTFLSALGVIFGVGSFVTMVAIGEGAGREVEARIAQLGTRNIFLRIADESPGDEGKQGEEGLTAAEVELLLKDIPGVAALVPSRSTGLTLPVSGTGEFESFETTSEYPHVFGARLQEGRFISALDVKERRRVCVLGYEAAAALGVTGTAGAVLRLGKRPYDVVGVLADRKWDGGRTKALPARNVNRMVFFPLGALTTGDPRLNEIVVHIGSVEKVTTAAAAIGRALARSSRDGAAYQMVVPLELLRHAGKTKKTYSLVLGSIAAVALLVGGIGIMNIMLATVTERRREIGIRRAVGATRSDILAQFLGEALILTVGGGAIGLVTGAAASSLLSRFIGWPTVIPLWGWTLAGGMSLLVGISAGVYPALQAADLDPVEAIRHE